MSTRDDDRRWRIGELAAFSGLSVRALRHYDELGLLTPADRTGTGYRIYDASDVRRLYRIVALRRLGLGLEQIARALAGDGPALADVVRGQRDAIAREIAERESLRDRLDTLCRALDAGGEPAVEDLITTLEAMTMYEQHYTPEQLRQLADRRDALGPEAIADAEREWAEIFDTLRERMAAGEDPADPELAPLRARCRALVQAFTGGDAGIAESMRRMWDAEQPASTAGGPVDSELLAYYRAVMGAG